MKTINGIVHPSVTDVLGALGLTPDFSKADPVAVEHAAIRGTALHKTIEYHHADDLDPVTIHPEVRPGFDAYLRFVKDTGHEPIASELELIHPQWHFLGHPDRIGWHQRQDRACYDWKYVASIDVDAARIQLAGYRLIWNALHPLEPVRRLFVLHLLRESSSYRLHEVTDGSNQAEQVFLGALLVWREKHRRGLL